MCLDIITTPKKLKPNGTGYKMFHKKNNGDLYFSYRFIGKQVPLPIRKWMNEKDYRKKHNKGKEKIWVRNHESYPMGFHIYLNKKFAEEIMWGSDVLIPVKFRKAHTKGKQIGINVIVAKEIFIQREV